MEMDANRATKLIIDRLRIFEPEHVVRKTIAYINFSALSDEDLIRLALGPDGLLHSFIQTAKAATVLPSISPPISPNPFSSPFGMVDPYSDPQSGPSNYCSFRNPSVKGVRNFPVKVCHYHNKGYCKHGVNCRYFHGELYHHHSGEEHVFPPGSLEKLELEITELLKSRSGFPVSIASLPMLYFLQYGKVLQAEGYLTESQRHGKAGYSLTKLLARLKNSIRLIDRPHGQHAIVLAEDVHRFIDVHHERNDPGPVVSGSRQIFMTFPAESTFTEEDVSNYFSSYGQVQDVRIPGHPKRMFGFVAFVSADTVKLVLSKGNPHFVCGARVLVKQYREKVRPVEKKFAERFDYPVYYQAHPREFDSELPASWDSSRQYRRLLMEEHERALELETTRLSQLQLANQSSSMVELKVPKDQLKLPSPDHFSRLLDGIMKNDDDDDDDDDDSLYPVNNFSDQESSQGLDLPDSPFAAVVASSISAVI